MTQPTPVDPRNWTYRRIAVYASLAVNVMGAAAAALIALFIPVAESGIAETYIKFSFYSSTFILIFYVLTPSLETGWDVLARLIDMVAARRGGEQ